MSDEYTSLTVNAPLNDAIIEVDCELPKVIHIDDNAQNAMIDFRKTKALQLTSSELIADARALMEAAGINLVLIVDEQDHLIGTLSLEAIISRKTIKLIESKRTQRDKMSVKEIMTKLGDIPTIELSRLEAAKVGHIVATLKMLHRHYLLVFESGINDSICVRGIFTVSALSKMLNQRIMIDSDKAKSISSLNKNLHK
jgi:CBS domain-containing protein